MPRPRAWLIVSLALSLAACKRSTPTPSKIEAGAPVPATGQSGAMLTMAVPADVAWDGLFGAGRSSSGAILIAVAANKSPWLRVLELDAAGVETKVGAAFPVAVPLASPASLAPFADGSVALVYSDRLGDPPSARMLSAVRAPIGAAVVVGPDWCGTEDSLYFLDRESHRLRRWGKGEPTPSPPEGPTFAAHAAPLCGTRSAFVLEPKDSGFDVVLAKGFARARVAAGLDPSSGGTSAFYVSGDAIGIVALLPKGAVSWTTVSNEGKARVHPVARKVSAEQTLVSADGSEDHASLLLQRDGKPRCGEDETPPSYDVLELGTKPNGELVTLPPLECESESSPPDLQQTKAGAVVRWFEWKDDGPEKRLRFWSRAPSAGDAGSGLRLVPTDTVLLDCNDDRCVAVGRIEKKAFRVTATP